MQEATLLVGVLVIASAWVPLFLRTIPISLPIIALAIGFIFAVFTSGNYAIHAEGKELTRRIAEFAMLLAVLGGGLKLDRPFSFRGWASTWRLVGIVMPLSIAAVAASAYCVLGLSLGLSILVGAALAPTDPVLASDQTVGPPGAGDAGERRFALTSEAGLNDGTAFPFVTLGVLLANDKLTDLGDVLHWLSIYVIWNVSVGASVGVALGWTLVKANSWLPQRHRLSTSNSGLAACGLAFVAYGAAQIVGGNGFVAVFCEAVAMRNLASTVHYSRTLNHSAEQFERVGMVLVISLLGASVMNGLFASTDWQDIAFAIVVLVVVRPLAVGLGFFGSGQDLRTRMWLGYFGIRGVASLFYAAYVAPQLTDRASEKVGMLAGLVVVGSVLLYGTTAHAVDKVFRKA